MLRCASSFPQGARRWRPAGALLTGGVAFPFRKDELGDCHPLKPLYNNTFGVWGAAPIGFPEGSRREKYAGGIFLGGIASGSEHY